jgi:hypothetical protein
MKNIKVKSLPKINFLRGWTIGEYTFHGKSYWVASRYGVHMNINSYKGIISMILNRPY